MFTKVVDGPNRFKTLSSKKIDEMVEVRHNLDISPLYFNSLHLKSTANVGKKEIGGRPWNRTRRGLALDIPSFTGGKYTELETKEARRRIKNVPYRVKATKAKQPQPEIEIEDDLVIDDDDDLDLIDCGDR